MFEARRDRGYSGPVQKLVFRATIVKALRASTEVSTVIVSGRVKGLNRKGFNEIRFPSTVSSLLYGRVDYHNTVPRRGHCDHDRCVSSSRFDQSRAGSRLISSHLSLASLSSPSGARCR